ncbi:MAG: ABC transporter ATP-binding protein [Planctomycetes bacterium]|nr:ABC transporter ATP-binding protein [Planctomycetota bacterium]
MDDLDIEQDLASKKLDRRMLKRMLKLLKPVRKLFFLIVFFEIILVSTVFIRPLLVEHAIDKGLIGDVVQYNELIFAVVILLFLWSGRFIAFICSRLIGGHMAFRVLNDLRQELFAHVHSLSMSFFDKTKVGRIVSRTDSDVNQMEHALIEGPVLILTSLLRFILATVVLYIYAPPILYVLLPLVPTLIICMLCFEKIGTGLWARVTEAKSAMTAHLVETIGGVRVIQQCSYQEVNRGQYDDKLNELDHRVYRGALGWTWFFPFILLLFMTGLSLVIWQGGMALHNGDLTPGEFTTCIFYVFLFLGPMADFGMIFEHLTQGIAAAQRIFLLLDTEPEVTDKDQSQTLTTVRGDIAFKDVSFAYKADTPVLKHINLEVPAGQTLAIVGPTGHGKSTLIQLLARFYDIDQGEITLDDHNIADLSQDNLHTHVGVVLQDNILFTGTILDNLRLASPDASDQELIQACKDLRADDIIERLPDNYYTQVGARGSHLSHGQRQLVCLVRAYLANPAVLILDEATSSIDVYTEQRVQKSLRKLCIGRTAIIIAHRLATIRDADQIIVIHEGEIVDRGNHESLIANGGMYAELYQSYEDGTSEP